MGELWACEYSVTQQCCHVDTLTRIAEINRASILLGKNPQFFVVGIFKNDTEASRYAHELQNHLSGLGKANISSTERKAQFEYLTGVIRISG